MILEAYVARRIEKVGILLLFQSFCSNLISLWPGGKSGLITGGGN